MTPFEDLLDYRRRVAAIYGRVRESALPPPETWMRFRHERDELFRTHAQSALSDAQKARFTGLTYYDYDPALRFAVQVDPDVKPDVLQLDLSDDGPVRMKRCGKIHLNIDQQPVSLSLFWIMGYGGGLFLHFRDLTNRSDTYGGGRYLLDTIKHADLGHRDSTLIIDFNYAYNPSCAYNARWHCPLFDRENLLPVPVQAGEKRFADFQ